MKEVHAGQGRACEEKAVLNYAISRKKMLLFKKRERETIFAVNSGPFAELQHEDHSDITIRVPKKKGFVIFFG